MRPTPALATCLFAASILVPAAASAQSFGLDEQTLTLPAAAFQPEQNSNTTGGHDNDGYLYSGLSGISAFVAPVFLPEGAEITGVCFDTNQSVPGSAVQARIQAVKLPGSEGDFGIYEIPGTAITAEAPPAGYSHTCNTDPVSYTFRESADLDGNGVRHLAHRIHARMDPATGLGALRITWRRQVSPAPASATFADVPASDGAFPFVEALVASGVTAGCGGGNYCPDAPLTRRQMAVFLSKALGLHWPN
jgi:hypothetical protein